MVKFAKQLEMSLVPEWKDAYCNYKALKRDITKVEDDRSQRHQTGKAASLSRSETLNQTLTHTMTRISTFKHNVGNQMKHASGTSGRLSLARGRSGMDGLRPEDFLLV